ncbi:MAG: hypothetical protein U0903_15140 [Planctomycetales bacterium]
MSAGWFRRTDEQTRRGNPRPHLRAKALVLSDGKQRFTLVTADLLGFPPPFKEEVVKALNDPDCTLDSLILLPSHSHGSIETNAFHSGNDYKIPQLGIFSAPVHKLVLEKFVAVIRNASKNLVPVQVGTVSNQIAGWNRNRRHQEATPTTMK